MRGRLAWGLRVRVRIGKPEPTNDPPDISVFANDWKNQSDIAIMTTLPMPKLNNPETPKPLIKEYTLNYNRSPNNI